MLFIAVVLTRTQAAYTRFMIKKLFATLTLLLFPLLITSPVFASTQDFTVQSFTADYYLTRTSEKYSRLSVEETIVAQFPTYDQNHGILRAIPKKYQGHGVNLEVQKVTDETGKSYSYTTLSENDNKVLKIGDANTYVHGLTTYKISYELRNVINFQNLDEFYWDINGDQWQQPMTNVTGRVHLSKELFEQLSGDQVCYTGASGSTEQNCIISKSEDAADDLMITTTAENLGSGQNVTFDIGFTKGTFIQGPEVAAEKRNFLIGLIVIIAGTLILPFITFVILYRKWKAEGKDPKGRGVIIPEYVSPKDLNVISSAYVLEQKTAAKALSAGIIEAAVQGYLRLSEIKKDKLIGSSTEYELEITKPISDLSIEQQDLISKLFDGNVSVGHTVSVNAQKNKLYSVLSKIDSHLAQSLTTAGYFTSNPAKARSRFVGRATVMLFAGIGLLFFIPILFPIEISLILSGVIAFVFSSIMPARSEQGVATRDYLLGLKEYIKLAEKDRLSYLQSPQGAEKKHIDPNSPKQQIKLFEDLLPYAMLFGLEKDWAKQFKDLYSQPPSWYSGNMNTFNAVYLANSLGSFNSATTTAFTAPSSSGSSGFGGGGFSGGGGGGGGGGGW